MMRCDDCKYSKETIPAQLHYVYCAMFKKEMSVTREFNVCQYVENELKNARNELCLKCGKYTNSHDGACDGCKWDNIKAMLNYM